MGELKNDGVLTFGDVKGLVKKSLDLLKEKDFDLLEIDASERSITHKLAQYIQHFLPEQLLTEWSVDCEYNRNIALGEQAAKKIHRIESETENEIRKAQDKKVRLTSTNYPSTYPDIIVHKRKVNSGNYLVIEVKKKNNPLGGDFDYMKLKAFTNLHESEERYRYSYSFGVFIELGTGEHACTVPNLTWFKNGSEFDEVS